MRLQPGLHVVAALEHVGLLLHTVTGLRELDHVAQVLGRAQPADRVLAVLDEAREQVVQHLLVTSQLLERRAVVEGGGRRLVGPHDLAEPEQG